MKRTSPQGQKDVGDDRFARFLGERDREESKPDHDVKAPYSDAKMSTENSVDFAEHEPTVPKVKFLFITMDCRGLHLRVDDATLASFIVAEAFTGAREVALRMPQTAAAVAAGSEVPRASA